MSGVYVLSGVTDDDRYTMPLSLEKLERSLA